MLLKIHFFCCFVVCEDDEEVYNCTTGDLCGDDGAETCDEATSPRKWSAYFAGLHNQIKNPNIESLDTKTILHMVHVGGKLSSDAPISFFGRYDIYSYNILLVY